ncbi:hypothetical protein F511_03859 [Dorcoceras hygrometricum]|nr:hypothetical protein F511_03859 [Dorcoceras hygrometricum]
MLQKRFTEMFINHGLDNRRSQERVRMLADEPVCPFQLWKGLRYGRRTVYPLYAIDGFCTQLSDSDTEFDQTTDLMYRCLAIITRKEKNRAQCDFNHQA